MIFDDIRFRAMYEEMHPRFREAFDFLEKAASEDLPAGRYEIDGEALYANIQEYTPKAPEEARFEAHRRYIDIQYIQKGMELMILSSPDYAEPITEYDEEKDVIFFEEHAAPTMSMVTEGSFGIFFPWDVHKPGVTAIDDPEPVKKILIKIEF